MSKLSSVSLVSGSYSPNWQNTHSTAAVVTGFVLRIANPNNAQIGPQVCANAGATGSLGAGNVLNYQDEGPGDLYSLAGGVIEAADGSYIQIGVDNLTNPVTTQSAAMPVAPSANLYVGFNEAGTQNGQSYTLDILGYYLDA